MRLLLVMLLVSGLLIGESQAQRPFVRFFNNLYANLRNRIGLGGQSGTSTTSQQQPTVTVTATVTTTVTDSSTSVPDDYVGFAPLNSIVPEISTEAASTDSGMSTTAMEESITEGASTDSPLIFQNDPVESSTPTAEDNQVELEIVTEGPELDHSDASVIEAMAQILLEIPTTTPESPTTPNVEFETEAIIVKDVPPVAAAVVMTSSSTTSYPRDSTTFATLAPKRTIHFSRPSWTPTFLKLANRGSTSRYFFPASFRRPKGNNDDSGFFEMETISLSPSRPLSVENSVPPRIPYVVKRQVEIESSMTVLNQQQSSVLIARAATD